MKLLKFILLFLLPVVLYGQTPNGIPIGGVSSQSLSIQDDSIAISGGNTIGLEVCTDVVPGYGTLRYTRTSCKTVIVLDTLLTGPDGLSYIANGGTFYVGSDSTENGGTRIKQLGGVANRTWYRDWDGVLIRPEWWVPGGYDYAGRAFVGVGTSSGTNLNIEMHGIYNETQRIRSAQRVGTILSLTPNKIYLIDRHIVEGVVEGNNATLKLTWPDTTTLASPVSITDNVITVVDASNFRVGQELIMVDTTDTFNGKAWNENQYGSATGIGMKITDITGNVITTEGSSLRAMAVGYPVGVTMSVVLAENAINIKNLTIDGNRPTDHINYDWRRGALLGRGSATQSSDPAEKKVLLDNVHFLNSTSGCITMGYIYAVNCTAKNLAGSFFHHSVSSADSLLTRLNYVYVHNLKLDSCGVISNNLLDHEDAMFTYSNASKNIYISNVDANNVFNDVFGNMVVSSDASLTFVNSKIYGVIDTNGVEKKLVVLNVESGVEVIDETNILIKGNYFNNCGDIVLSGKGTGESPNVNLNGPRMIVLEGNDFVNTRVVGRECGFLDIINNRFRTILSHGEFVTYTYYSNVNEFATNRSAFISLFNSDRVRIVNNYIEGDTAYNSFADMGILIEHNNTLLMIDSAITTEQYYHQDILVAGNYISGVSWGIGPICRRDDNGFNSFFNPPNDGFHVNWVIKDNTIILEKHAENPGNPTRPHWGICAAPGYEVDGNTIYMSENPVDGVQNGIMITGFDGSEHTLHTRWVGAVITNNKIYDANNNVSINGFFAGAANSYNNYVALNQYQGTLSGLTNSVEVSNTAFSSGTFPSLTNIKPTKQRMWLQSNDDY